MASGNLGHITFPREPGRVTLERLEEPRVQLLQPLERHAAGLARQRDEPRLPEAMTTSAGIPSPSPTLGPRGGLERHRAARRAARASRGTRAGAGLVARDSVSPALR